MHASTSNIQLKGHLVRDGCAYFQNSWTIAGWWFQTVNGSWWSPLTEILCCWVSPQPDYSTSLVQGEFSLQKQGNCRILRSLFRSQPTDQRKSVLVLIVWGYRQLQSSFWDSRNVPGNDTPKLKQSHHWWVHRFLWPQSFKFQVTEGWHSAVHLAPDPKHGMCGVWLVNLSTTFGSGWFLCDLFESLWDSSRQKAKPKTEFWPVWPSGRLAESGPLSGFPVLLGQQRSLAMPAPAMRSAICGSGRPNCEHRPRAMCLSEGVRE